MEGDPLLQVGSSVNSSPTATKTTTWVSSASLIVANMLGAGVLGLPFAVKGMGWAGAVVVLVFMTCMSIFGGLQLGSLRGNDSSVTTYAALARRCASKCWGPRAAKTWSYFVSTIGYTYILGTCTIYLITMKISVMEVLQKCEKPHPGLLLVQATNTTNTCSSSGCSSKGVADLHDLVWLFIVCALVYPLTYLRSLADAAWVSYVGVATIVVVNSVILVYCVVSPDRRTLPHAHAFGLTQPRLPKGELLGARWKTTFFFVLLVCFGLRPNGGRARHILLLGLLYFLTSVVDAVTDRRNASQASLLGTKRTPDI
eukprot:m.80087 g.80087  ORF g.80087 m.80087 type:complete len:313 (+) comp14651_c0_seq1:303-1241(+)